MHPGENAIEFQTDSQFWKELYKDSLRIIERFYEEFYEDSIGNSIGILFGFKRDSLRGGYEDSIRKTIKEYQRIL